MIVPSPIAKLINLLPDSFVKSISKKIMLRYMHKYANITIVGGERLKELTTPTIFVCNHLSNSDGLLLAHALKEIDPTFVAGVKLSNNAVTNLGISIVKTTTIIPNTADYDGLKKIINLVRGGESVLIFPEGTRSRVGSLIEAKKGILFIAKMTGVPLTPVSIYGSEKLLPINQDGDMTDETFHHADVCITIGEQFSLPKITKEQSKKEYEKEALSFLMKKIAALLPEDYRGVYK